MDRINLVDPDVIIIEKDISRTVLSKIRELNITVVTNVKRNSIEKIARCTETLIIPSVNLIEKHFKLGSCKRFFVKLGQNKLIKEDSKIMSTTQSLIYFDGCKPWYGSTICLSGPNDRYLRTIKKYLKKSLKYCRDLVLEKEYLFLSDGDSKDGVKSPYLLPKVGIGKTALKYVKVLIRQTHHGEFSSSNIYDENHERNSFDEHEDNKFGENEAQVKKNMNQICGKPEKKSIEFYSAHDITLGGFLLKTASDALEKCDFCKEKMYKHVTDIYHGEGYVEISVSINEHHPILQTKIDDKDYEKNPKFKGRDANKDRLHNLMDVDPADAITMYEE